MENKRKINNSKISFFEKYNKLDWPLARIIEEKEEKERRNARTKYRIKMGHTVNPQYRWDLWS